jgi:tetratricopeptide (TPR) repeat protein
LTRGDTFQLLLQLTEKSLAVADESELSPRWRLLETLRQFGHERLVESGELDAWRARHLAYFADWAENITTQLDRGHPLDFRLYMEGDLNNLRAALAWALDPKANRTDALRLVSAFSLISLEYSLLKEGEEWVRKMLPLADQPEHRKWRAVMLHRGAYLIYLNHWRAGIQDAYDFVKESERIARELGDRDLLASAIYHQYEILVGLEKYEEARLLMEESVEICRATGYQSQLNCSLTALGIVLTKQGKMDQAMEHIEKAIQVATQIHDLWGQEFSLRTLGTNLRLQKKYPEALKTFACSLEVAKQMGDRLGAGIILANMSIVTNVLEDYHTSGKYAQEAFVIFQTIGSEYQMAFPLRLMAYAAIHAGNLVYARELNLQSLKQNHSMGDEHRVGLYGNLVALAEILLAEKQFERAARLVSLVESHTEEDQRAFQEPDTLALARVRSALEKKKFKQKADDETTLEEVIRELKL